MGGPRTERVSPPPSPYTALTIADMISNGWKIRGRCSKCETVLVVSLDALARSIGPSVILWGRTVPCPRVHDYQWRCEGRMDYLAQTVQGGDWQRLQQISDREIQNIKIGRSPINLYYNGPPQGPAEEPDEPLQLEFKPVRQVRNRT